jgi:tripartite-type tricarboxylate transporter receptor subunit TctC
MKARVFCLIFLVAFAFLSGVAHASTHEFFKGKTVRLVVGFSPGGTFDLWARVIAQHLGKHIPGNPSFIVQNMPGGGSMIAANYVYAVAKPDGLTIGTVGPSLYIEQLMGRKEIQYDWAKFSWIGQPEQTDRIFYMRADTPYKTLEDIRKATVAPKCGATGVGTASHYWPKLLEDAAGLKFDVVAGYGGASDVNLAIEKGEVYCWGGTVQAFFGSEPGRTWAKAGFVRVLIQGGRKRHEKLPDVPTIWEVMDRHKPPEATKRLVAVMLGPDELGRPYIGAPGIPSDRVKMLRDAFMKTMNDPELLAEVKKRDWATSPTGGEELQTTAKDLMVQPPEVIEQMKKLLAK